MPTPRVFTYHCAYCSNLFLASTHDFSALPKRKDPGLDHAIIVPLPPPPKSEDESDSSSEDESSSEEENEPQKQAKPVGAKITKKQDQVPSVERRGKEVAEEIQAATPAILQEKADKKKQEELPAAHPNVKAPGTAPITSPAAPSSSAVSMAPPPAPPTTIPPDSSSTATSTLQTREKDDYTLILSLTKDRAAQIITREDGFEKRWIWRCGRCRIISGYQLDDVHFDPPGSGASEVADEKEKKRIDRKRKRYLYILPGAAIPTEELGRELKEKEIDVLALDV